MTLKKSNTSASSSRAHSMSELMARPASKFQPLQKGTYVKGTVKKLTPSEILLDIGAKSDALVIEYDKLNLANLLSLLKVGDTVEASVISPESEEGFPVVSLRRMLDDLIFEKLLKAKENDQKVMVTVLEGGIRGGYFVQTQDGIRGFLPNSQILDEKNIVGRTIEVCVIEVDRPKKRIIFSQKATVFTVDPATIQKFIKKDQLIQASINNISPHGIYVTIEPSKNILIEGFIHISEISYQRVEDIRDKFEIGQKIKALVLDIDPENRRINLSIKRLETDKFEETKLRYKIEDKIKGKVFDVKSKGVTIELEEGVLGFIQASKIPSQMSYAKGDMIDAEVSGVDEKRRLILLTPVLTTKFVGYR